MEFQQGAFGILKGHFPFGFFPPFVCEVVMVTICGIWSREGTLRNMGNENRTRMNEGSFFADLYMCGRMGEFVGLVLGGGQTYIFI